MILGIQPHLRLRRAQPTEYECAAHSVHLAGCGRKPCKQPPGRCASADGPLDPKEAATVAMKLAIDQ